MRILITGVQGSGKSAVAKELFKHGIAVVDSDTISKWVDISGEPINGSRLKNSSEHWLNTHSWIWDEKIKSLLESNKNIVVCGVSKNQYEYFHYFDIIFCLNITTEIIRERLANREGEQFGTHASELAYVLRNAESIYERAKSAGAIIIDAGKPLTDVVEDIIKRIRS